MPPAQKQQPPAQAPASAPAPMQLAHILSDLTSLRICDPAAALALVSARPPATTTSSSSSAPSNPTTDTNTASPSSEDTAPDADLERAKALLELHYSVREAQRRGEMTRGLEEARRRVWGAVDVAI